MLEIMTLNCDPFLIWKVSRPENCSSGAFVAVALQQQLSREPFGAFEAMRVTEKEPGSPSVFCMRLDEHKLL
jgi:hypothetical protein